MGLFGASGFRVQGLGVQGFGIFTHTRNTTAKHNEYGWKRVTALTNSFLEPEMQVSTDR